MLGGGKCAKHSGSVVPYGIKGDSVASNRRLEQLTIPRTGAFNRSNLIVIVVVIGLAKSPCQRVDGEGLGSSIL
jgi:hypothetical protein